MWSELTWFMWSYFYFEVKLSELSYGEVLGDKSAMYIRVIIYWGYIIILWLFHLGVSCTVVVSTCFVMCRCVYVGVLVICVLVFTVFCIVCTLFFCIVSFMYIYSYLFRLYWCKDYCYRVTTQLSLVIIIIIIIITIIIMDTETSKFFFLTLVAA
jgi:hypothetical protein